MNEKTHEILEAAAEVFAKYGYKKSTMQDIGDRLNMTKSNLYLYFDNKEDLYIKSVSYQLAKWSGEVKEVIKNLHSATAKFEVMCKKSFEYINENKIVKDLVENDPDIFVINHDNDRFLEVNLKSEKMVKEIITEGMESGEFRQMNADNIDEYLFSTYMMFLIKIYSEKDRFVTAKLVDDVVELLKNGLLAK